MWKCDKCQREFKTIKENHFCSELESIDEYIACFPDNIKSILIQVRDTLKKALPDAKEKISWRMPTFWQKNNIIHFAAFKNHLGIYPGAEAIVYFADQLVEYKTSKGAIQFPYNKIPLDLIAEIAKWNLNRFTA